MPSAIKVISLKQVMVDGQLVGPVSDLLAKIIADAVSSAQTALEQYQILQQATSDQALAAQAATSDATIADLTTQLATANATLADTTAQLATATAALAKVQPAPDSGIPAEGEQTAPEKLAAAIRDVVAP